MGEFVDATLGDVIELKRGYDLPQQDRLPGSVPIVSSSGITSSHSTAMVRGPGVITGRYGTLGQVFYVIEDFWPLNTTLYVRDFKGNDPCFISYFLRSLDFSAYSDKAAVPGLNRNHLHLAPVRYPADIDDQRAIATILSALDDKIGLNRRMNETLEAMARAIFKDWFVEFGPTRAKMEGRAPYLAPEIWALFPDRLDDEGKPEGWGFEKLGSLCARVAMGPFGSDITTDNFVEYGVPVIRGGNLKNGFIDDNFVYVTEAKADALKNANATAQDIVITHRGTLGQVGIIPKNPAYRRYVVSQSQMLLAADHKKTTPRFIFEFLRSTDGMQQLLAFTSQTGVPAIGRPTTSLKSLDVIMPSRALVAEFDNLLAPLVNHETANILEIGALVATRDLLLPKLMSGEIRVKNAEKLVEAVV